MSESKLYNNNNDQNISNNKNYDELIIPISEIKSYEDSEKNDCLQYDSGELTDYSNLSLTPSHDSSGSNLCVHHNKINPLNDPIIQEMFKQRTVEMDQVEEERRIRMYTMMRYSKKYKHMQKQRANMKWDQMYNNYEQTEKSLKDSQSNILNSEENALEDNEKLSNWFSDNSPKIHRAISFKQSQSNFGIDLHDLDLIDMELNNCSENSNDDNDDNDNNNSDNEDNEQFIENNKNDSEHKEIVPSNNVKIYTNNKEQSFDEVAKSNSKISTSSSENETTNNNELIKSHYKFSSRSIGKVKSRSICFIDPNTPKINNYFSNSDINDSKTLTSSITSNNDYDNYDNNQTYLHNDYQSNINTFQNKDNKDKKKHKKLKLFNLVHKNKNTIVINDANTLNKVDFNSKNSADNNSDETVNPSISLHDYSNEDNFYNKSMINSNGKKKKLPFVRFFLGKKYSKSNETNDDNVDNNEAMSEQYLKNNTRLQNNEIDIKKILNN
ncbi:hypothetical protein BCR36DRAFT_402057 [Piromyces finnis]|uniref:Uncharacterized protein n=1 Tax=Piromyces finnis TaxID=1754191 RepID=A0A1Y1VKF5_9FUNG|nr:hypothetical protein BCR36DRAFT_402057 [Piromyces finnis]|eukprot:ORX58564.1 hypothetical protein BCR36DRAFT_402057 [Piromyces finnis]